MYSQISDQPLSIDLEQLNQSLQECLVSRLGIRCTYVGSARVEGTMPVDERTCQPFGLLHGGASLAFAETISGVGTLAIIAADEQAVGQQVSGNHLSAAKVGDCVRGVATLMHKGRSSHVWHVDMYSESTGKLVSTAQVLYCVQKKQPSTIV